MDLLALKTIKFNEKFLIHVTDPNNSKIISKTAKSNCKVFVFSSECNIEDVLTFIDKLDPKEYLNLFIFVIKSSEFPLDDKVEELKTNLLKFGSARPLVLQITSKNENSTTLYYTEEDLSKFTAIEQQPGSVEDIKDFPTFLRAFFDENFTNSEITILDVLLKIQNRSLILRFLWTLTLSESFYKNLIRNFASVGTLIEFLAALDASLQAYQGISSKIALKYLSNVFGDDEDPSKDTSAIFTAVESINTDVIDFLIYNCSHLIQQLPFDHQVKISTAAFETGQLDVLCDLLDIVDYPYPNDLNVELIVHERLKHIIDERSSLAAAIVDENIHEIVGFIDANSGLKVAYNTNNKSALQQAVDASKIKIYTFLKFRGFYSTNPNENFDEAEKEARNYAAQQRKQNIIEGQSNEQSSVNLLCNKSLIHNKGISKEQQKEYRKKIRSWYKDINKIESGQEFLNVAASCDGLKILFDFENNTVS